MALEGDPLANLTGDFRTFMNNLLGGLVGSPQYPLNSVADLQGINLPNVKSLEDIQTQIIDASNQGLDRGNFDEAQLNQLEDDVRRYGQAYLDNPNDPNTKLAFVNAQRALETAGNNIRGQTKAIAGGQDYLSSLESLFAPGTAYYDALDTAQSRLDNPVYSDADIKNLIGMTTGSTALKGAGVRGGVESDLAARGLGGSAVGADLISNARINLIGQLNKSAIEADQFAQTQNATARADLIAKIGQLEGLKTGVLGGARGAVFNLGTQVQPGIGVSDPDYMKKLTEALGQVGLFNEQLSHQGFNDAVDTAKNDIMSVFALGNASKQANSGGGSSSGGSFGAGIPGFFSYNQQF